MSYLRPKQVCGMQTSRATAAVTTLMYSGEAITLSGVTQYRQEAVPYSKVIFRHILNSLRIHGKRISVSINKISLIAQGFGVAV